MLSISSSVASFAEVYLTALPSLTALHLSLQFRCIDDSGGFLKVRGAASRTGALAGGIGTGSLS